MLRISLQRFAQHDTCNAALSKLLIRNSPARETGLCHFFSFARVKTPRDSLSKLSALPSSPSINVVTEGVWVAPENCIMNAPLFQCFNVAGYFAGPNWILTPLPSGKTSQRP